MLSLTLDGHLNRIVRPDTTALAVTNTPSATFAVALFVGWTALSEPCLWKQNAATGALTCVSPLLGNPTRGVSSPAIDINRFYAGHTSGIAGNIAVLNADLVVLSFGIASDERGPCLPARHIRVPLVRGSSTRV